LSSENLIFQKVLFVEFAKHLSHAVVENVYKLKNKLKNKKWSKKKLQFIWFV